MLDTLTTSIAQAQAAPAIDAATRVTAFILMAAGLAVQPYFLGRRKRDCVGYVPMWRYMLCRADKNLPMLITMGAVAWAAPDSWFVYVGSVEVVSGLPLGTFGAFVVGVLSDVIVGRVFARFENGNGSHHK